MPSFCKPFAHSFFRGNRGKSFTGEKAFWGCGELNPDLGVSPIIAAPGALLIAPCSGAPCADVTPQPLNIKPVSVSLNFLPLFSLSPHSTNPCFLSIRSVLRTVLSLTFDFFEISKTREVMLCAWAGTKENTVRCFSVRDALKIALANSRSILLPCSPKSSPGHPFLSPIILLFIPVYIPFASKSGWFVWSRANKWVPNILEQDVRD